MRIIPTTLVLTFAAAAAIASRGGITELRSPRGDAAVAPPLRAVLTVEGERLVVPIGTTATLADGRKLTVDLAPTRVFDTSTAFEFEFPHEWRFTGAGGAGGAWWNIAVDGAFVKLERDPTDAPDPDDALDAYVGRVQGGHVYDVRTKPFELAGRTLAGRTLRAKGFSLGGGPAGDWTVECGAFRDRDGTVWIIAFHRTASDLFDVIRDTWRWR